MIYLYGNGNTDNHGCEALSKTLPVVIGEETREFAVNVKSTAIINQHELIRDWEDYSFVERIVYKVSYKLRLHDIYNSLRYKNFINQVTKNDICLSIGGDNYCYSDVSWLASLNKLLSKKSKTILMGNSIEADLFNQKNVVDDLQRYDAIFARESFTYDLLCKNGFGDKSFLYPDSAFVLEKEECSLPQEFELNNVVGINISPMIIEAGGNNSLVLDSYKKLIEYILESTKMQIALIPHVVWERSDDRVPLKQLYDCYKDTNRVILIGDHNCCELKYIISKCKFFVAARTHASIAAYSTCVPTLVVGYSIKARGIAKDLFGDWENYVIPAQELDDKNGLVKKFIWLQKNEDAIRAQLSDFIPEYQNCVWEIRDVIGKIKW